MAKRALSWKRAAAIGWRDLKSAPGKFGFVVLSVAVGVAALVGVRGLSDSFRADAEYRGAFAAGGRSERAHVPRAYARRAEQDCGHRRPKRRRNPLHVGHRDDLDGLGAVDPVPLLVSLKAVDPAEYPFYGTAELEPAMPLQQALQGDSAVVADEFLIRLNAQSAIRCAWVARTSASTAVLKQEPDRISAGVGMGPRVMISQASLHEHRIAGAGQPRKPATAREAA